MLLRKGNFDMNEDVKLKNCDNHYTVKELYDQFGIHDHEVTVCMNCSNHRMEGGIITCKYILDGVHDGGDESNGC